MHYHTQVKVFRIIFCIYILLILVCIPMCVCVCVCAMAYVWRSENNLEELILSFTYMDQSRDELRTSPTHQSHQSSREYLKLYLVHFPLDSLPKHTPEGCRSRMQHSLKCTSMTPVRTRWTAVSIGMMLCKTSDLR